MTEQTTRENEILERFADEYDGKPSTIADNPNASESVYVDSDNVLAVGDTFVGRIFVIDESDFTNDVEGWQMDMTTTDDGELIYVWLAKVGEYRYVYDDEYVSMVADLFNVPRQMLGDHATTRNKYGTPWPLVITDPDSTMQAIIAPRVGVE